LAPEDYDIKNAWVFEENNLQPSPRQLAPEDYELKTLGFLKKTHPTQKNGSESNET
jgi:hypothetical protein